jgi:peroxiredoxin Q/BCP
MRPGDDAPNFTLPDQDTVPQQLSRLVSDGPVVLTFYPAMTERDVAECCHFRDLGPAFDRISALRIGISGQSAETHQRLIEIHQLDFPLLSDFEGRVAAAYGVVRRSRWLRMKQHTFVIDSERRIVAMVRHHRHGATHAELAMATLLAGRGW